VNTSADWRRYFADILVSGDTAEVGAAAAAAAAAERRGANRAAAAAAGKDAARQHRRPVRYATAPPMANMGGDWPQQLAPRLFAPPARWGWEAAPLPVVAETAPPAPTARPVWIEPQRPDSSALYQARSKAISRVVWRTAFTVVAAFAFTTYQLVIEQNVDQLGGNSAHSVYKVVLIVIAGLFALGVLRAVAGVRYANRNIRGFEQPYLITRAAEQDRHREALRHWEDAVRRHTEDAATAARAAAQRANGPLWYPVHPAPDPTRVDVFGGDPRRHGWASLLVTFGTALLAAGRRITVLDFTGQQVGDGLARVAEAAGTGARVVRLNGSAGVDLIAGLGPRDLAASLGHALTSRPDGDHREERAFATDVLRRVLDSLTGPVTFARLAAGVRVLRQGAGDDELTEAETSALTAHIGDIDQNEWTTRQLRFYTSQLGLLHELAPAGGSPLWTHDPVALVETDGVGGDRTELVERLLVQLVQRAMTTPGWAGRCLVVAGADSLGAATLQSLSEHARLAGVWLVLMIDQPQGDLEKTAGTGGMVCVMKMYNHRDANIAAEFIGKGHKFVVSQVTRQVGTTFTDGGGDSFAATTNQGGNLKQRRSGTPGRPVGLSDSRGHTWTGTRNWSNADNLSTSTVTGRVYEFIVDPQEILGMPETSFILVDNSGHGRRMVLADANPGICLLDRVSAIPAAHHA